MAKRWALAASFEDTPGVFHAAEKLREEGYSKWEVFSPFPIHGLDYVMGLRRSRVPVFTFIGGAIGFVTGCLTVWFMNAYDYPLVVGGKPLFSFIYPFPVFYELTILLAAFGTLGGMFITNRLPRHNHPVFNYPEWVRVTNDRFLITIEMDDPKYSEEASRKLLETLGGKDVRIIGEDDEEERGPSA